MHYHNSISRLALLIDKVVKMNDLQTSDANASEKLKEIKELVDEVYRLKEVVAQAEKEFKDAKNRLTDIMQTAEVDKMSGNECTASLQLKESVTVPKEDTFKKQLFDYIKLEHGSDVLFSMLTINPRTFSSWYTKEVEQKALEGDLEFKLDMLSPYEYYSVGLRKRPTKAVK